MEGEERKEQENAQRAIGCRQSGHVTAMSVSMSIAIFSVAQIVKLLQSPRKRVL